MRLTTELQEIILELYDKKPRYIWNYFREKFPAHEKILSEIIDTGLGFNYAYNEKVEYFTQIESMEIIPFIKNLNLVLQRLESEYLINAPDVLLGPGKLYALIELDEKEEIIYHSHLYELLRGIAGLEISYSNDFEEFVNSGFLTEQESQTKREKEITSGQIKFAKWTSIFSIISVIASIVIGIINIKTSTTERKVTISSMPKGVDTVFVKIDSRKVDSLARVVNEQSKEVTENKMLLMILLGPKMKQIGSHRID